MSESPRERIPSYVGALAAFGGIWVAFAAALRRTRTALPARYTVGDLVTGGIATHKFTRIVSKAGVTTPLRAPFTVFEGEAGDGEVHERPREQHPQHTIGELLTCPFCLAPWVSSGYVIALALAPRAARTWGGPVSLVGADVQHRGRLRPPAARPGSRP
jgi:hypothetical protein